ALHASHRVVITAPDRDGAVSFPFDRNFHRHEGCRAVVLWPVEFDTARDPGPRQTDQSGLNHILPIKEVVAGALIHTNMNPTANLRHDHQPQELIFEMDGLPAT